MGITLITLWTLVGAFVAVAMRWLLDRRADRRALAYWNATTAAWSERHSLDADGNCTVCDPSWAERYEPMSEAELRYLMDTPLSDWDRVGQPALNERELEVVRASGF